MQQFAYFLIHFVDFALSVLQLMMFARAIISWFPIEDENAIIRFLYMVTEPVIAPIRDILNRFAFFQRIPVDLSYIVAFLLISVLQFVLALFR